MSLEKLLEEAKTYVLPIEKINLEERNRLEFISKFPLERIGSLSIDEYVAGTGSKDSLSYWLEFKKISFGIGGGTALKFGIYKSKEDGNYYGGTGKNKILLKGDELEKQFQLIKNGILKALDCVKNDKVNEIKNIDSPISNMVLQKILFIYNPDKFIPIGAAGALIDLANDFNLKNIDLVPKNLIEINYRCRKNLNSLPEFKDWSYEKLGRLVWKNYRKDLEPTDTDVKNGLNNGNPPIVNYKETYIRWMEKSSLENSRKKSSYQKAIEILSEILHENLFEQSDLGKLELLYLDLLKEQGVEGGKYFYKDAPSYGNSGFYSAAINSYSDFIKAYLPSKSTPEIFRSMKQLNTILFGPPGTGKTYNSINRALDIIGLDIQGKSRKEIKAIFDAKMKEGQIVFTTFHQSMSYEDFIEGIKPVEPKIEGQHINYKIIDGIFKRACALAAYNSYKIFSKAKSQSLNYSFDDLYEAFTESIQGQIRKGAPPVYKTLREREVEVKEINSNDSIIARAKNSIAKSSAPLTKENLQKLYDRFKNIEEIEDLKQVQETVQITPRITEFYAVFSGLKEFEKTYKPDEQLITETKETDALDFGEIQKKFNAGVYKESIKRFGKNADPVVLIIDEVNRGNVSQIFGELITLIEDDKRLGKDESLEATLPYSKEKFGVPPNLYIIGTMNTADRSVEALDAALRRRFNFEEMPPIYGLEELQYEFVGIPVHSILKTINKRIEKLLDKDHTIGHSYFMVKSEANAQNNMLKIFYGNIIPLLQEYFFGDYGKIGMVIGKGFIRKREWNRKTDSFAEFEYESSDDFDEKEVYEIINYTDPDLDYNLKIRGEKEERIIQMTFEKAIKLLMMQEIE
jgi:5-methylcytosine-specific restriction enzyme B